MPLDVINIVEKPSTEEARRVMQICNACRYCEGFCAVFPAMTQRRDFPAADLDYLANLCHNCSACYYACQYADPHEFNVNVPKALAEVRLESYEKYAWPAPLAKVFHRNGLIVSLVTAVTVSVVLLLAFTIQRPDVLLAEHKGPGAFYQVISHGLMVLVAGSTFLFSVTALFVGFIKFCRSADYTVAESMRPASFLSALKDAASLKYLGGGHGDGCNTKDETFSNQQRYYHQLTMWGFILCFLSTSTATVYEYGLGQISPFPFFSLPVMLGTIGGLGMLVGPAGLLWVKLQSDTRPKLVRQFGMDFAFIALLFFVSLTGFALLAFRETSAMGILLTIHLGFVLTFFLVLPYSKFVHAVYRFAALMRFALERPVD